jgi:hypothetical protein
LRTGVAGLQNRSSAPYLVANKMDTSIYRFFFER